MQLGEIREGLRYLRKCIEIAPNFLLALNNLGAALVDQGKAEEALFSLRRALSIEPNYPHAHYNLGRAIALTGRHADALKHFADALRLMPDHIDAAISKGLSHLWLEQYEEALLLLEPNVASRPDSPALAHAVGRAYHGIRKLASAESAYRHALSLSPDDPAVLNDLGLLLMDLARDSDAIALLRRALEIVPSHFGALLNLSACLIRQSALDEAELYLERARTIRADSDQLFDNWGLLREKQWRLDEARAMYQRALEIRPDSVTAMHHALLLENYFADSDSHLSKQLAVRFGHAADRLSRPYREWAMAPSRERSIRVGFVSGDLRNHSVGFFLRNFVAELDRQQVTVCFYPTVAVEDAVSKVLKDCASGGWRPIDSMSDAAAAALIYADEIDVLFDLSGHTAHTRLSVFAYKPAPVQVAWLGYCATTGMEAIDYYLADAKTLPPSLEAQFVERVWRMPDFYLCASAPACVTIETELPARINGFITFGSFNSLAKISLPAAKAWSAILNAVPNSRLMLKAAGLEKEAVKGRVAQMFEELGLFRDRLVFCGFTSSPEEHFAKYGEIDIALDPFPYNGVTTTVEALWMGVPVVTVEGDCFLSRQGAGLLSAVGLDECVASDTGDLIEKARTLAGDLPQLDVLRKSLRERLLASPLMDAKRFARAFEREVREMYELKRQELSA